MPTFADFHHAYGAMVGINLPWLSGRHRDEEREAEETIVADRHALESTKNTVRYELRDAAARVDSARQSFTIIDQDLLAQAKRSLEATAVGVRRRPGRCRGVAGRPSVLLAGADRARAGAGGAGVEPGGPGTRRGDVGHGRREAMSTVKGVDDKTPPDPPPIPEGPPQGVATMSIVRWVLVLAHRSRRDGLDPELRRRPHRRREEHLVRPALPLPDASVGGAGPPRRVPDLQHDPGAASPKEKRSLRQTMKPAHDGWSRRRPGRGGADRPIASS